MTVGSEFQMVSCADGIVITQTRKLFKLGKALRFSCYAKILKESWKLFNRVLPCYQL